jgi:hypothetical protein
MPQVARTGLKSHAHSHAADAEPARLAQNANSTYRV